MLVFRWRDGKSYAICCLAKISSKNNILLAVSGTQR
jgi:hypothetical protein